MVKNMRRTCRSEAPTTVFSFFLTRLFYAQSCHSRQFAASAIMFIAGCDATI
jgi:hypothetical protein